jgi:serine/threonine-protein kinase RsbW
MQHDGHGPIATEQSARLEYSGIPARAERLPPLRHALAGWARSVGLGAELVEALTLAADEALANTVIHAYPDSDGTFDLSAVHLAYLNTVEVTVSDHGRWCPPPADPGPLGGRGLPLIHQLAENIRVEPTAQGTVVSMRWTLGNSLQSDP